MDRLLVFGNSILKLFAFENYVLRLKFYAFVDFVAVLAGLHS